MPSDILKIRTSKLLLKLSCINRLPKKVHLNAFIDNQKRTFETYFYSSAMTLGLEASLWTEIGFKNKKYFSHYF